MKVRLPGWLNGKESPANAGDAGDMGSIPGSGRSSGVGHGNPFQYSCLKKIPWTEEAGRLVHRVTTSWTHLSTHAYLLLVNDRK